MSIDVTTVSVPINVSASGTKVEATVSGGIGPQGPAGQPGTTTWAGITDKPATFAPAAHTHAIADVTGLQAALDAKATPADVTAAVAAVVDAAPAALDTLNELAAALGDDANFASTVTTALAGKADTAHSHVIADVTGLQAAIDGKQAAGAYADAVHTHVISDVSGLQAAIDGKQAAGSYAAATHIHVINDVTGLGTVLNAKANLSSPTFTGTVGGITRAMVGLANVPNVDATARANHTGTQTLSTISDAGTAASRSVPATGDASSTQVVLGSDTRLTNARTPAAHKASHATGGSDALTAADIGAAAASHTHAIADVTGLQTAMDGKQAAGSYAAASHTHTPSQVGLGNVTNDIIFSPFLLAGM